MAKPIKTLELHYQMIQFLIIAFIIKDILPLRTLFDEDLSAAGNKKKINVNQLKLLCNSS